MVHRCPILVHRYLTTIQLPDFLSAIQINIHLTDHLSIGHIFTITILDDASNQQPIVRGFQTVSQGNKAHLGTKLHE